LIGEDRYRDLVGTRIVSKKSALGGLRRFVFLNTSMCRRVIALNLMQEVIVSFLI